MTSKTTLSRRTVLRGALLGAQVTVALPVLEAMLNGNGTAFAQGAPFPKRFGVWFFGNGIHYALAVPSDDGPTPSSNWASAWSLTEQLKPLANVREYLTVVRGTRVKVVGTPHHFGQTAVLTGATSSTPTAWETATVLAPSIDVLVRNHWNPATRFKSLELASDPNPHGGGTAMTYISHEGPNAPNRWERDPRSVFDRLFGAGFSAPDGGTVDPAEAVRRSVLDSVLEDAAALKARLGTQDAQRLERHLEAVRSLEKRIAAAPLEHPASCVRPLAPPSVTSHSQRTRLLHELLVMALACDLTRVFTFMFTSPASHLSIPELGIGDSYHELGHREALPQTQIHSGIVWNMQQYAHLLELLKNTQEGEGNLLDACGIMATSDIAVGKDHGRVDWPFLIAGKANGALRAGITVTAVEDNACKVPFTMMKAMGLPVTSWGQKEGLVSSTLGFLA